MIAQIAVRRWLILLATLALSAPPAQGAGMLQLPGVAVQIVDRASGGPAAGVEVELLVFDSKQETEGRSLGSTVTGEDGRADLPAADLERPRFLGLRVSWDEAERPRRALLYRMRLKKGKKGPHQGRFPIAKEDAFYLLDGELGGDCSNLFQVEEDPGTLRLRVEKPETYLDCGEPDFRFPDLAAIGQRSINQGKLNAFSFDDDLRLGRDFFDQTARAPEQPLLEDPLVADYVQTLVDRIGRASDMPQLTYHVRVIDADVLNAFALPGGYVFVYRGLIEATETESELVGVLAHEIAHVTSRHGTEGMTSAIAKATVALALGGLVAEKVTDDETARELIRVAVFGGTQFWILGGTRKREAEADHLGAQYAWRAGYNPRGLASFFDKLSQSRHDRSTRLDQLFSDHPSDDARVRDVGRKVDYFLPRREGLIVSSPEYLEVKRHLAELPPPRVAGEVAADALFSTFRSANEALILGEIFGKLGQVAEDEPED